MERIDKKTFTEGMENGGIWVLTEESSTMRGHVQLNYPPERYEEEIIMYRTPTKYIKEGNTITIVSVTEMNWRGISQYNEDVSYMFNHDVGASPAFERRSADHIVSDWDYEDTEELIEAMIKTGYITREEWDKYIDSSSHKELKLVKKQVL